MIVVIPAKMAKISTIASCKIARYLADYFGCELYGTDEERPPLRLDHDIVLYVGYPPVFAPLWWHKHTVDLILQCKKWVYCENDYNPNVTPTSLINTTLGKMGLPRFNKQTTLRWTTLPDRLQAEGSCYVNWNMLTYTPFAPVEPTEEALCYWGAPRPDRMKYFKRFLSDTPYKSVINTTSPGRRKMQESTIRPTEFISEFKDLRVMQKYSAVLYIEDEYSHAHYCSPANRFYEALSLGRPIIFDKNCIKTFDQAGFEISPFVASNKDEVFELMGRLPEIAKAQAYWHHNYDRQLKDQVFEAFSALQSFIGEV